MKNLKKIKFYKKKIILNEKGNIMHFIKKNDKNYTKFGEVYFTWIKKNQSKGWKFHKRMHMNLSVPVGNVKFVFYDKNFKNKRSFNLGKRKFGTLYVPPKVWFSFENLNEKINSLVINFSNIIHEKNECIKKDMDKL